MWLHIICGTLLLLLPIVSTCMRAWWETCRKRTPKHGRFYPFYFAATYENLFLQQCISWDVFVVLQHLLFSTTSKGTWPREIKAVFLFLDCQLAMVAGMCRNSKRTAGRECQRCMVAGMCRNKQPNSKQRMVTGREWVTSMDPLIPGVEQIRSRIGSWENERGLSNFSLPLTFVWHIILQFIHSFRRQ
jgi:hypothetical protein